MKYIFNIFKVSISNVVSFGTSFIIGFLLPAVLTVADYGKYRQFLLYTSFAYIFNLGFNDGIYIKYGGKEQSEINRIQLVEEHSFIHFYHFTVLIIFYVVSFFLQRYDLILFGIAFYLINIVTFYQNFIQAIGEFSLFSYANIFKSIVYIGLLVYVLFVVRSENYITYNILYVLSYFMLFLIYIVYFIRKFGFVFKFSLKNNIMLFKTGILILTANMSIAFVGNIGNWVINLWYSIEEFAIYSFQNSLLNVILLIVKAVSLVFYNLIAKHNNIRLIKKLKQVCLYIGIGSGLVFFAFKYIIINFLPQYNSAVILLSVTFIAIPYIMNANILITNMYKVTRSSTKYFTDSILYAIVSFILLLILHILFSSVLAISIGTTLCYILWYYYCTNKEFSFLKGDLKELFLTVTHIIIFYFCANYLSTILGGTIYLFYILILLLLYRKEFLNILAIMKKT